MFFQLAAIGTYVPILSIYLKDYLGFSAISVGIILSIASLPSILAPFLSAWIVDRIITSRRFLVLCHLGAAILIAIMSFETSYSSVLITYFIYTIFMVPTSALVNALVFHYMEDGNSFGVIRVWGTIGWVVAGWIISLIWKVSNGTENLPLALQLSAFFSVLVVFLTLKLPKLELHGNKKVSFIPHEAMEVIKKPEVVLLFILIFISSTADKFLTYGMPIFLNQNGVAQDNILIVLSLGQIPEALMLFTLGAIIRKLGFKNIFVIALSMQIVRYAIFYFNGPIQLTLFGILIHGFIYAFFYAAATIYLDNFTDKNSRGGVHQIFNLIYVGMAGLLGNLAAGYTANNFLINGNIDFKVFWLIPWIISVLTFLTLIVLMKRINRHN